MTVSYNINFELAAFIFIIILYLYLRKKYYNNANVNVSYRRLVLSQLITVFLDLVTSITISYHESVLPVANLILNTIYFASLGITCYLFGSFYLSFARGTKFAKTAEFIFRVILGIYSLLLVENIPTGIVFNFANGNYEHGPLYMACFLLPMSYFVWGFFTLCYVYRSLKPRTFGILCTLGLITVSGPIIQAFFLPNYLLSNFFSIFALFFCLFILISPNYTVLAKKRAQLLELQKNLEQRIQEESEKALKNEERMNQFSSQIVDMLAMTINIGGSNRVNHSENVGNISRLIASEMKLEKNEIQKIYYAAILHDIGIIGIPEEVIEKKDVFTDSEYRDMKRHCEIGAHILQTITEMPGMDIAVRSHHERFDGTGYPDNLKGEEIPVSARIIAVAEAYDAMTHDRFYKKIYTPQEAVRELKLGAGTQFDPEIVDIFVRISGTISN